MQKADNPRDRSRTSRAKAETLARKGQRQAKRFSQFLALDSALTA